MLVNRYNILKKPYVPPIIEFEELEELMDGDVIEGSVKPWEDEESDDDPLSTPASVYDFDFSMDFVINDEPQL